MDANLCGGLSEWDGMPMAVRRMSNAGLQLSGTFNSENAVDKVSETNKVSIFIVAVMRLFAIDGC